MKENKHNGQVRTFKNIMKKGEILFCKRDKSVWNMNDYFQ